MSKIYLGEKHLRAVQNIVKGHGGCYVFGSRASGKHKKLSDLDLCFIRNDPMTLSELSELKTAFEESDLPFVVDIVDYRNVSPEFQSIIDNGKTPLPYKD